MCVQTRVPSELKQLHFCAKRKLARKTSGLYQQYGNFKSVIFTFSLYSLLSMVEGGWLKMSPKRKFRELKTADEEKALLGKSVPKSTRYVKKWSFNIVAQWQNARLNKQAANEEAGDVERDKIQSQDRNIVNMTAESLNFWLLILVSVRRMGNGIRPEVCTALSDLDLNLEVLMKK